MQLDSLFYPKSVAICGASHDQGSVGYEVARNLLKSGYQGKVYLVNPKKGRLLDQHVYGDLADIKQRVELVVVIVPAKIVPSVLRQAGDLNIKAVIVISAGFKEAGHGELETEIAQIAQQYGMALVGPNCLGLLNPEIKLNASFAPTVPDKGHIAFVSQSGAIVSSILDIAQEQALGFSKFVSLGNKAVIREADLLEYLYRDEQTHVIAMYVEELQDVGHLLQVAKKVTRGRWHKPIIVLKAGRTEAGSKAAKSHTGSLAGSDAAYQALFNQSGMIRAESLAELFELAEAFDRNQLPRGSEVAVVTNAGGPGVLTADALATYQLQLAQLPESTQKKLRAVLPAAASVSNPVDVLGDADAERYQATLEILADEPAVKGLIVVLTPQAMTEVKATAKSVVQLKKSSRKPIVVSFIGEERTAPGTEVLNRAHVTTTDYPEPAAKVLSVLWRFKQWLQPSRDQGFRFRGINRSRVERLLTKASKLPDKLLAPEVAFEVLEAYGLPVVKRATATTAAEAARLAARMGSSVVLKIVSPDISHKTEVGGVKLDVPSAEVKAEYEALLKHVHHHQPKAELQGVEVMEMVKDEGLEIIVGVSTEPTMGKLVMVGWGGIYTEVVKDVQWGLLPLTHEDVTRMIHQLKISPVFDGVRGQPPLADEALEAVVGRIATLARDFPEIKEIDLNPVKVLSQKRGAKILDARIILE